MGSLVETLNQRYFFSSYILILLAQFDFFSRYRQISTFGSNTIRRFSNNASKMKKLTARDFEDLL